MPNVPIPTPERAAKLRADRAYDPMVNLAASYVRRLLPGSPAPQAVARLLATWSRIGELNEDQAAAVVARYVVEPDSDPVLHPDPVGDVLAAIRRLSPDQAGELLRRWAREGVAELPAAAGPVAEHRVVIRLDGGDYAVSCTGCSLRWRAPSLRAAEKTRREHQEQHQ